ncbi:MAG TPA: protein kinase, partial [Flavilitoribacter sp.]|nr:protein kinase [Flavilitoribacter sp.]
MKVSFSELQNNQELKSGKYKIVEKLGSGGFGITYKASYIKEISIKEGFHEVKAKVEVPVAIKELFIDGKCIRDANGSTISLQGLEVKDFEHFRLRFLQEAETLADFHEIPQIVQVIDYFEENNTAYMVMNFVDGVTLANHVKNKGPMQEASVRYLITEVASGLKEVHASQILHRDISPENIILTPENKVVLIDFGAARAFLKDKTVTNSTILKPGYAPIEQYGQKRRKGPWTDIYALGATSWYALTTEKPVDTTDRISGDNPFLVEGASEQMNAWLEKATAYEGGDRFADCAEVLDFWHNDKTLFVPSYEVDVNKTRFAPAPGDQADNDRTQVWELSGNANAPAQQSKKQDVTEEEAVTNSSPAYLYDTLVVLAFLFTLGLIGISLFVLFGKGRPTEINVYIGYFIFYILTGLYFTISFMRKWKPRSFISYWAYGSFFSLFAFLLALPSISISSFFIALPALPIFILFSRNLGGPRTRGQRPEQTPPYSFAYRPVLVPVGFYTAVALYVAAF